MEERRARSSENLRSSGRASQRFCEVVSHGPTAIPAREDVDAAISSVLSTDELTTFRPQPLEQQRDGQQPRNVSIPNGFPTGTARAPNTGSTATIPGKSTVGENMNHPPGGMGNGVDHIGSNTSGGGGGGLLGWALWPLWGTIDALKWAGGTVNEVAVAPVIRMASPWGLAGSVLTTVKAFTPQRARDLARVAGNLGLNAAGLARTPAGGEVLRSSGRATGSLSMAVSSPAGRQFLLESATGLVKLAEALDTPEAKNFLQQGAVVAARGMDALASRHSKIFVKDLADVIVQLVGLANSREATTMAAEFTVNVEHALEMEHLAGIARRAVAKAAAGGADADVGSIAGDAYSASAEDGGAGHDGADGGVDNDGVLPVGVPGDDSQESAGGATEEEKQTLDELVRKARLERARQEGGGGGNTVEGPGSACHRKSDSACSSLCDRNGSRPTTDDGARERRGERASLDRSPCRGDTTPITRQADIAGDMPLSTCRSAGTAPVSPTKPPPSDGTLTTGTTTTTTDTSHSAPSSPCGRYASSAASSAAATAALTALDGSLSQGEPSRGRASTITGAGFGTGGGSGDDANCTAADRFSSAGAADSESPTRLAAGPRRRRGGGGNCVESDGTESVVSSARPAVEYERDGNARLPRFKWEHIASVLRGKPLGLELQLEAPNEDSLDDTVARASRLSMEGASPCSSRAEGASGSALVGAVRDAEPGGATGASPGEEGVPRPCGGATGRSAPGRRAEAGGWKNVVFACLLLLFAGDGLRHRWKSTFRSERKAASEGSSSPPPPSTPAFHRVPFGREKAELSDGGGGGGDGGGDEERGGRLFGAAFLPPTCHDHVFGRTMAVWATPSGPCVSPASIPGDKAGGGGPGCSPSFRLCSAAEIVVPGSSDGANDGSAAREEL